MIILILALALAADCPGGYCARPVPRVRHLAPPPAPVVKHAPYVAPAYPYHAPVVKHKFAVKHGFHPFKNFHPFRGLFGGCGR